MTRAELVAAALAYELRAAHVLIAAGERAHGPRRLPPCTSPAPYYLERARLCLELAGRAPRHP